MSATNFCLVALAIIFCAQTGTNPNHFCTHPQHRPAKTIPLHFRTTTFCNFTRKIIMGLVRYLIFFPQDKLLLTLMAKQIAHFLNHPRHVFDGPSKKAQKLLLVADQETRQISGSRSYQDFI
jgi:hypothetical protein